MSRKSRVFPVDENGQEIRQEIPEASFGQGQSDESSATMPPVPSFFRYLF